MSNVTTNCMSYDADAYQPTHWRLEYPSSCLTYGSPIPHICNSQLRCNIARLGSTNSVKICIFIWVLGVFFIAMQKLERQSLMDNFGWTFVGDAVDPNCSPSCDVEIISFGYGNLCWRKCGFNSLIILILSRLK